MNNDTMDSRLLVSTNEKSSLQNTSPQNDIQEDSSVLKQGFATTLGIATDNKIDLHQEPKGIDNRLRAIFGKIVSRLSPCFRITVELETCFQFLQSAAGAEDANDRASYFNVISQMWEVIQENRELLKKITKRRGNKRLKTKGSTDDMEAFTGAQLTPSEYLHSFSEGDLRWINKYAEFASLITQVSKWNNQPNCLLYLTTTEIADRYKDEEVYDSALVALREKVKMRQQALLTREAKSIK